MRCFAAVVPPADVRTHLVAELPAGPPPRLIPPERWHLTLAFYGEVTTRRAERLGARLARVAERTPAFQLALAGSGCFPVTGPPRVLWCGLTGDLPRLERVAKAVRPGGGTASFRPHLTLARARGEDLRPGPGRSPLTAAAERLAGYRGPSWTVRELVLMQSHLGPRPRYEMLGRFPVRADRYQA